MCEVRVEWEGPYPIKQVYGMCALNDGPGLYQIYGRHVIYGSECLLYIGRTEDTFGKRVRSNYADWKEGTPWYQNDNEVSVRIARDTFFGILESSQMSNRLKSSVIHRRLTHQT